MRANRGARWAAGLAVATVLALVAAGCGSSNSSSSTNPSTNSSTTAPIATTTTKPASANFAVYLVHNEKLVAAGRSSSGVATPARALEALLAGPEGSLETDLGMGTQIPVGTVLRGVTVDNGVATVDLSKAFESGGGSQSMQARVAQVVFTVTQFPGVEQVRFELDGTPVNSIGGEGVMVDGVGRADFANVTPAILVESPTPAEQVSSPLHVRGIANTFEATVNYTITDPEGLILKEGFTTATAGNGTWGTFSFDVRYQSARSGMGSVIVYQVSPKDGSRQDILEVPVQMAS